MRANLIKSFILVLILMSQTHCGSDSDSVEESGQHLQRRTIHNGKDQLLQLEEYFYESSAPEPTRIEISAPNAQGNLVVVKMKETLLGPRRHEYLEVSFDPKTLEERRRETVIEKLGKVGNDLLVTQRETTVEAGGEQTIEVVTFTHTVAGNEPKVKRQKTVVDDVPVQSEEWEYDAKGRPLLTRVVDGDGNLLRSAKYDWQDGSFTEEIYNAAGKVVEHIAGESVYRFGRVIRTQEERLGQVIARNTSCTISGRKLACLEATSDRISGEKIGLNETEVALDGKDATERPIEEKHERYDDETRVLVVSDDWQYRSDRQVEMQIHGVDSANQAAVLQFREEFDELFDFRLAKEYNQNALPVREHKQTEDPLAERLIRYEY